MKEYEYSIIRRVSRNPKRNREGRGISQSDLEALRQELSGDQRTAETNMRAELAEGVGELVVSAKDMRQRLKTAEEELEQKLGSEDFSTWKAEDYSKRQSALDEVLRKKLGSEDFRKWKTEDYSQRQSALDEVLRKKLGSEDFSKWRTGELAKALAGKASTGDVQKSARDAIAEAVKRAGEMDKQIKVGGRNLLRAGYFENVYFRSDTDKLISYDDKDKKITYIGNGARWNSWVWLSDLEAATTINLRKAIGEYTLSFSVRGRGTVSFEVVGNYKTNYSDYKTTEQTLTEDWQRVSCPFTRSAEDSSLFCLYNGKPETGDWVQFADDWKLERGTVATDWTPAPEDVGESVSKVSESLTKLERSLLDPQQGDINKLKTLLGKHSESFEELSNHPPTVDEAGFWRIWNLKQQQYVTTQYKSRGEKGEDAGRYLGRAKRIHPDLIGNYLLEPGGNRWRTAKEGDYVYLVGDDPNRGGDKDTYYIVREHKSKTDWEVYNIKGHSPSAEDVLKTELFENMLGGEVKQQVIPVSNRLTTAQQSIADLSNRSLTRQQKEDLGYLTSALRLKMAGGEGEPKTLEGLALQRYIALSGDNKTVSAYLASSELTAVLKAGVTGFGTLNEREQVAINHDGTGHLGNLHFAGNQIDFKTGRDDAPYLSIGAWDMEPIDRFVKTTRVDDTPVSVYSLELSSKRKVYEQTISVANDGTRLTVHIDQLTCDCVLGSYAQLTLDGHLLATWRGMVMPNDKGLDDGGFGQVDVPYHGTDLSYERVVSAGTHKLRLEVVDKSRGGLALDGLTVRRYYDSGRRQSLLTKDGMRFFASADRYLDVDYRSQIQTGTIPILGEEGLPKYDKNPYIVRIKGGAKVDKLTVDELDMPGVPLCGASFDASGSQVKAFGEKAKRRGYNQAQAVYYDSGRFFRVYHSIGHTDYLPTVQVIGDNGNDINWNLTARIYAVNANDFAVRIITNGDNPIKHAFSFVAFKTM